MARGGARPALRDPGRDGGWIIATHEDPAVVTLHFAVAFVVLGVAVAITVLAHLVEPGGMRSYARITAFTALMTYGLLLVGTYVRAEGAGLAFRDWPLMSGRLVPDLSQPGAGPMFAHRLLAIAVTALVAWCVVRARTMQPRSSRLVGLSTLALVLVLAQIAVGALNVVTELATWARAAHVAVSALIWATVVALAVTARREPSPDALRTAVAEDAPASRADRSFEGTVRAYAALTKPRGILPKSSAGVSHPAGLAGVTRLPPRRKTSGARWAGIRSFRPPSRP